MEVFIEDLDGSEVSHNTKHLVFTGELQRNHFRCDKYQE